MLCMGAALKMASRRAAPRSHDSRIPHVHSTHRDTGTAVASATTHGHAQGQGPWKHYQLKVDDGQFEQPVKSDDVDYDDNGRTKMSTLDPGLRAGCVPATAYPSFRTLPPPPPPPPPPAASYRPRLPRVSLLLLLH